MSPKYSKSTKVTKKYPKTIQKYPKISRKYYKSIPTYPKSIPKVSKIYPKSILKLSQKYHKTIPKVSSKVFCTFCTFCTFFAFCTTGTRQSAAEYSLLLKKPPTINKKILTPPKLCLKNESIIAFRIALTLDVKILLFGCQLAVSVQKRHKNAIFWCSWFQKFNFCLLLKPLICSPKTENIFIFVCPLLTQSSIMILGT